MKDKNLGIVIPAYNEEKTIKKVISELIKIGSVIVVDDFSSDKTFQISSKFDVCVIKNKKNLGYDLAVFEGIKYGIKKGYKYLCTFDADSQHQSEDITKMLHIFKKKKLDLLIGNREKGQRVGEIIFNFYLKKKYKINDIFSGIKFYSRKVCINYLEDFNYNAYGTKVALKAIKNNSKFEQFKIKINQRDDKPRVSSVLVNLKIINLLIKEILQ